MDRKKLLSQVKSAVREVEPTAEVILYGSRARGEAGPESDWDFLVLVDGRVDENRKDLVRHRLYEIEWDCDEVISAIVHDREQWHTPRYQIVPLHQNVQQEGIVL